MAEVTKPVEFRNAEINKKYVITSEHDNQIDIPNRYKGPLSGLSDASLIDGMIERGSNLVAVKQVTTPTAKATAAN